MAYMIHKRCGRCGEKQPLLEFYIRCDTGGRLSICRTCNKRASTAWQNNAYKTDPDFRAASIKRSVGWGKNNKAKFYASIKKSRRKARAEVNLSYAKEVITKHSFLKISEIPDSLARAKQVNLKLKREVRSNEKH